MGTLKMPEDQIFCKSAVNGHMVKVTAIFESVFDANRYPGKQIEEGVIYQADNLVFCSKLDDLGIKRMSLEIAKSLGKGARNLSCN